MRIIFLAYLLFLCEEAEKHVVVLQSAFYKHAKITLHNLSAACV